MGNDTKELVAAADAADLRDDKRLPPLVLALLDEGRAVIDAERREKELREEAAAGARRAVLKVNSRVAAEALVQLEPKAARLMPWASPIEDTLAFASPPEFQEMRFEFNLPGFLPVRVMVRRSWEHVCQPTTGRRWLPWRLDQFGVMYPHKTAPTPYPSLGIALAHAREQWLKEHEHDDVPF